MKRLVRLLLDWCGPVYFFFFFGVGGVFSVLSFVHGTPPVAWWLGFAIVAGFGAAWVVLYGTLQLVFWAHEKLKAWAYSADE